MGWRRGRALSLAVAVAVCAAACGRAKLERRIVEPPEAATLDRRSPYLKVHMRNGDVYVLRHWNVAPDRSSVSGTGDRFDPNRELVNGDFFVIPVAEVALFETNVPKKDGIVAWLTVLTGASLALTGHCIANPKSCFGSCPTFYVTDGRQQILQAEAFSEAVAPSLEARDLDALYRARPTDRDLRVRLTNEALETHVIRHANILVAERPEGGRVVATRDGDLYAATALFPLAQCEAAEGSCLDQVSAFDGVERRSLTDGEDLATREVISIDLGRPRVAPTAVVVAARQTFITTFLFYQGLAYLGSRAGEVLASLERNDELRARMRGLDELLGRIEVQALGADGEWVTVGSFSETGPIATDVQVVLLPEWARSSELRLRLTQGHWRVDWVAGAAIAGPVSHRIIRPHAVHTDGRTDAAALSRLLDPDELLTTLPGNVHELSYELPEDSDRYELFLDARGYYLEWMREEWLEEESSVGAALLLLVPEIGLKVLAPRFKQLEPSMEDAFWRSRYGRE